MGLECDMPSLVCLALKNFYLTSKKEEMIANWICTDDTGQFRVRNVLHVYFQLH